MAGVALLLLTTVMYAGYNLLVKQSASHAESVSTSTITATIALQVTALAVSVLFLGFYRLNENTSLLLPSAAYWWAIAAGLCIGVAEIGYFYVFAGVLGSPPMPVSVATPTIVGGTIFLALLASWLLFAERLGWAQLTGAGLIVVGILLLFQRPA